VCFHLLTVLKGRGTLQVSGPEAAEVELASFESLLVPAALQEYQLRASGNEEPLVVMKSYVSDLVEDIVRPLRESGVPKDAILQLGGDPRTSDLGRIVWPE
jgi:uncharacterized protein YjlB